MEQKTTSFEPITFEGTIDQTLLEAIKWKVIPRWRLVMYLFCCAVMLAVGIFSFSIGDAMYSGLCLLMSLFCAMYLVVRVVRWPKKAMQSFKIGTQMDVNHMVIAFEEAVVKVVADNGAINTVAYRDMRRAVFYKQLLLIFLKNRMQLRIPLACAAMEQRDGMAALLSAQTPAIRVVRKDM